jgi:hypothetical protein
LAKITAVSGIAFQPSFSEWLLSLSPNVTSQPDGQYFWLIAEIASQPWVLKFLAVNASKTFGIDYCSTD